MRVNLSSSGMSIFVSGPMMSFTLPPELKLPSQLANTMTLTSSE